ncbi:MAG: HD domain-containing protein [Bacilli bacterium]
MITFEDIKNNKKLKTYIAEADEALEAIGFTEHSFAHMGIVSKNAGYILETLGYPAREIELARIAGYMHDIGNLVNRADHSQSGALMAFVLLNEMGMDAPEIAKIVAAIGNHDEGTGSPVSAIAAAVILADKSDVRRNRVRGLPKQISGIHERVNFSVKEAQLKINSEKTIIKLKLFIDTKDSSVMEYFEIFMERMILCRKSAQKLGLQFKLIINEQQLI